MDRQLCSRLRRSRELLTVRLNHWNALRQLRFLRIAAKSPGRTSGMHLLPGLVGESVAASTRLERWSSKHFAFRVLNWGTPILSLLPAESSWSFACGRYATCLHGLGRQTARRARGPCLVLSDR